MDDVDRIVILIAADNCLRYLAIKPISNLANRRNITLLKKLPRIPAKRANRSNAFLATFSSKHLHPERFLKGLVLWAATRVTAFPRFERHRLFSTANVLIFIEALHSADGWWNYIPKRLYPARDGLAFSLRLATRFFYETTV